MALTVRFTEFAFSEMEDAKEYYNLQQENLGDVFKQDVRNVVDRILKFPKLYPIVMGIKYKQYAAKRKESYRRKSYKSGKRKRSGYWRI